MFISTISVSNNTIVVTYSATLQCHHGDLVNTYLRPASHLLIAAEVDIKSSHIIGWLISFIFPRKQVYPQIINSPASGHKLTKILNSLTVEVRTNILDGRACAYGRVSKKAR